MLQICPEAAEQRLSGKRRSDLVLCLDITHVKSASCVRVQGDPSTPLLLLGPPWHDVLEGFHDGKVRACYARDCLGRRLAGPRNAWLSDQASFWMFL